MQPPVVRARLLGLRAELRASLDREREELRRPLDDFLDRSGQHPAEAGTDLFLREWTLASQRSLERELAAVEDAIGRLDRGTYGICAECGRPIEPERLAVRPHAIRRVECERRARGGGGRGVRTGSPMGGRHG